MTIHKINIGLTEEQRQGVMNLLNQDLADAYVLLVKTKKYHWDVVGPQFRTLHKLWEEHYQELTKNIDKTRICLPSNKTKFIPSTLTN